MSHFFAPITSVRGNAIDLYYQVTDQRAGMATVPPGPPQPLTPDGGVKITVKRPDGTVAVNDQAMTAVGPTGLFRYTVQTTTGDLVGPWSAQAKTTHQSAVNLTPFQTVFILEG